MSDRLSGMTNRELLSRFVASLEGDITGELLDQSPQTQALSAEVLRRLERLQADVREWAVTWRHVDRDPGSASLRWFHTRKEAEDAREQMLRNHREGYCSKCGRVGADADALVVSAIRHADDIDRWRRERWERGVV